MTVAIATMEGALLWGLVGWHAAALVAGLVLLAFDERRLARRRRLVHVSALGRMRPGGPLSRRGGTRDRHLALPASP